MSAPHRILLTGAGGFVGGNVLAQAGKGIELHAISGKPAPLERAGLVWHQADVLDFSALEKVCAGAAPEAVIHSAAIADIDFCERERETARRMNVELTREIARLCKQSRARLVFVSTDTVFDGERGGYAEEDAPGAVNYYAETKIAGEAEVRAALKDFAIARTCLVMGLPIFGAGNTFLPRMIAALERGETVRVPSEEIRSPIDVVTLARALLELAQSPETGIFHLAGNDTMPRVEMARRIARRLGFSPELIEPIPPAELAARAKRPRDVSLSNARARKLLRTPMLGLEAALDLAISTSRQGATRP